MKIEHPDDPLPEHIKGIERRSLPDDFRQSLMNELFHETSKTVVSGPWWVPPQWLGFGVAACWGLIFSLQLMTPKDQAALALQKLDLNAVPSFSLQQQELFAALDINYR